jgi:hypothetical protein
MYGFIMQSSYIYRNVIFIATPPQHVIQLNQLTRHVIVCNSTFDVRSNLVYSEMQRYMPRTTCST